MIYSLSKKERRKLQLFLESPYFNRKDRLAELFRALRKRADQGKPHIEPEQVWNEAFQNLADVGPFVEGRYRLLGSELYKLVKEFLAVEWFRGTSERNLAEVTQANERNHFPGFELQLKETKRLILQDTEAGMERYFFLMKLEEQRLSFNLKTGQYLKDRSKLSYQSILTNMDICYFLGRIRYELMNYNSTRIYNLPALQRNTQAFLQSIPLQDYLDIPLVKLYLSLYYYLHRGAVDLDETLQLLTSYEEGRWTPEQYDLYCLLINHSIHENFQGNVQLDSTLYLYEWGFQNGVFHSETGFPFANHMNNIFLIGRRLGKRTFVEEFLEKYQADLPQQLKENYQHFYLANSCYEEGELGAALEALTMIKQESRIYYSSRWLKAQLLYDRDAIGELDPDTQKALPDDRDLLENTIVAVKAQLNRDDKTSSSKKDAIARKFELLRQLCKRREGKSAEKFLAEIELLPRESRDWFATRYQTLLQGGKP